jgi:putative oxidoreductase
MAVELQEIPTSRVDRVGRTGIYPVSGPLPSGDASVRTAGELGHPEQRQLPACTASSRSAERAALLMGRAIFGGYFAYNGVNHFLNAQMMTEYARSKKVPLPRAAVIGSGVMALVGGLSLLTGYRPKIGASLISGFLVGVTPQMHNFWRVEDPQQRMHEFVNFTKNIALIGAACFAAAAPEKG